MSDRTLAGAMMLLPPVTVNAMASSWQLTLRHVLFAKGKPSLKQRSAWEGVEEALIVPSDVERFGTASLSEVLGGTRDAERRVGLLLRVAEWWESQFGDQANPEICDAGSHIADSLRQVSGMSLSLADRILCHALQADVVPLSTAVMRITIRHGWLDPQTDYEEAQSVFRTALANSGRSAVGMATQLDEIGHAFCGVRPKCHDCPLSVCLPDYGPIDIE